MLQPFKTTQCQFCTEMSDLCYLQKSRFYYLQNLRQKIPNCAIEVSGSISKTESFKKSILVLTKNNGLLHTRFLKEHTSLESQTNSCFLHMWVKKSS